MMKRLFIIAAIAFPVLIGTATDVAAQEAHGIEAVEAVDEPQVKVLHGMLELTVTGREAVEFHIYSITGQLVKTITVADGSQTVDLPQGYYIVRCARWAKKVVVK